MLFQIEVLLKDRRKPLCVGKDTILKDALAEMIKHDYSQLPVIDEQGRLAGIVSEKSITHRYFHLGGNIPLLNLTVDHCLEGAVTLSPKTELFEALDRLKDAFAVVIVADNQEPVGIITDYDSTHFFRDLTEGLLFVEDIETTLRQYVEQVYATDDKMRAALVKSFGVDKRDPTEPAKSYDRLSFFDQVHLITSPKNWPDFESYFGPRDLFTQLMNQQVRPIRNQMAHFRGRPDEIQFDVLHNARQWLASRPRITPSDVVDIQPSETDARKAGIGLNQSKYDPLYAYLIEKRGATNQSIRLTFTAMEELLDGELPPSAREHRSWWGNDYSGGRQSRSWLGAGWQVVEADLSGQTVTFRQSDTVLIQLFFTDVLMRIQKKRSNALKDAEAKGPNWWRFDTDQPNFAYVWGFGKKALDVKFSIRYEETGDNVAIFKRLKQDQTRVEQQIEASLDWRANEFQIVASIPVTITVDQDKLEAAKEWLEKTTLQFIDAFEIRLKSLNI